MTDERLVAKAEGAVDHDEDQDEAMRELIALERRCAELRGALGLEHRLFPAALTPSAERAAHALVAEFATDFLSVHAADGSYLWASPACRRLFGWEPAALVGRSAYDFFHPEDLERLASNHSQHVDADVADAVEYRFRMADGGHRWVETHSTNCKDSRGVPQIVCMTRDVSARRAEGDRLLALLKSYQAQEARLAATDTEFLRLCAWCKAIGGEEESDWTPLETYLAEAAERAITHGICTECAEGIKLKGIHGERDR